MTGHKILPTLLCIFPLAISASEDFNSLKKLWNIRDNAEKIRLQDRMQVLLNQTPKKEFDTFDNNPAAKTTNPLLRFYDCNLDRLKKDIPATQVKPGNVVIWYLYNMGFVIKTPTVCFGVDIHHRRAVELADLLDFIVTTHNHDDHWSIPLLDTMTAKGKPVVSNFHPNAFYTKASAYTHNIAGVTIHCGEADHNAKLKKFTMPMEIICPTGDRNFVFFTSGDCASESFLERKSEKIHVYAVHPRCGMKAIKAARKLNPDVTFIVHLQEMGHPINYARWKITDGRDEAAVFAADSRQFYLPVWGEKILWDGEKIYGGQ